MKYEKKFIDSIPDSDETAIEKSKPSLSRQSEYIKDWIKDLAKNKITNDRYNKNKLPQATNLKLNKIFSIGTSANNDDVLAFALYMYDYVKIETAVNRAKHISEYGISYTPQIYHERAHDQVILDNFNQDNYIENFEFIESMKVKTYA